MSDGLPPEAAPFWAAITGVFGAALGACGLWLASRMMGKAAFQTAINQGFQGLTASLQAERDSFRQQLAEERVTRAAIEAQLRGEMLNLTQTIESLKHLLIRHGIDVPMPHAEPGEMTVLEGRKP